MKQVLTQQPIRVGAKTHTGKVRTENQDRMGRFATSFGELFIVADGMGGHKGGAMAATMMLEGFDRQIKRMPDGMSATEALQRATALTNEEIYLKAHSGDPATENMGATAVLALLNGNSLFVGHAGDSRAYLFRNDRLMKLTRDHSVVQRMVDNNMLTEVEARDHPDSSVITRAFGQKPELELELSEPIDLRDGDGVLLCSDGLCGYVDDTVIERVIGQHTDAQQVTDRLIDAALAAGGEDNVTVQFLQFGVRQKTAFPQPRQSKQMEEESPQSDYWIIWLGVLLGVLILAVILAFYWPGWLRTESPTVNPPANGSVEPNSRPGANQRRQPSQEPHANPSAGGRPEPQTSPDGRVAPETAAPAGGQPERAAAGAGLKKRLALATDAGIDKLLPDWTINGVSLSSDAAGALKKRTVYYRPEAEGEAKKVAMMLHYRAAELPEDFSNEFADYDIIVFQ